MSCALFQRGAKAHLHALGGKLARVLRHVRTRKSDVRMTREKRQYGFLSIFQ